MGRLERSRERRLWLLGLVVAGLIYAMLALGAGTHREWIPNLAGFSSFLYHDLYGGSDEQL